MKIIKYIEYNSQCHSLCPLLYMAFSIHCQTSSISSPQWCCDNCPRGDCPRRRLSEGTFVQRDFCPRAVCPRDFCPRRLLSKETFVKGNYCPRRHLSEQTFVQNCPRTFYVQGYFCPRRHQCVRNYIETSIEEARFGQLRGRRPQYQASALECVRHHSVRKWKYIMKFELDTFFL